MTTTLSVPVSVSPSDLVVVHVEVKVVNSGADFELEEVS